MKPPLDRAALLAAAAPGALLAGALAGTGALLAPTLAPAERAAAWALLEPRLALVALLWLVASLALGTLARRLWQRHGAATGRLAFYSIDENVNKAPYRVLLEIGDIDNSRAFLLDEKSRQAVGAAVKRGLKRFLETK